MTEKDTLFAKGSAGAGTFVFDAKVVRVFPDMISRSVPGYELVVPMTGLLARRYAQDDTNIYDLGCSLGAVTMAMRDAVRARELKIIAVDNSAAMVRQFRKIVAAGEGDIPVEIVRGDVREFPVENASVVVMNFTLQFVESEDRLPLLTRIANGLCGGGALILSEKIRFGAEQDQERHQDWYQDYKKAKGYSDLEISGKRTALENVLQPDTEAQHVERLEQAGFERVTRWFQCFNFVSYIAFVPEH